MSDVYGAASPIADRLAEAAESVGVKRPLLRQSDAPARSGVFQLRRCRLHLLGTEGASKMLRVGLTGSIAVGKSRVLTLLNSFGCITLDADQLTHDLLSSGSSVAREVVDVFGTTICDSTGTIDRRKLAAIIFADPSRRTRLNSIIHPCIREAIEEWFPAAARQNPNGIAVVDAALIIEAGCRHEYDRLIVVFCDERDQLARVIARDGLSRDEALQRLNAQLSSEEKRKHADFEIDTSGPPEATETQVRAVFEKLRTIQSQC